MEINKIIKQQIKVSLRVMSDAPNANCEERKAKIEMRNGFTLLELLLVIAIIATLAGLIFFALNPADRIQEANETKYLANAKDIEKALNSYVVDNGGNLPSTFNSLSYGYYDICKQGQSGSCVSIDELVSSGKISSIPVDSNNQTGSTTGFKVRYDPLKREGVIYSNAMYTERIESGTTLTEGLVGWWKMDEASWGTVADSSGRNNNGTALNGAMPTAGKFGNAGNFDGINDYMSITNTGLNLTGQISVVAWLKNSDTTFSDTYANYAISKGIQGGPNWNDYVLTITPSNKFSFFVQTNIGGYGVVTVNSYDTNYHLVVGTFDPVGNQLKIYVDGNLENTVTTSGSLKNTNSTFYIGDWNGSSGWHFWNGRIDDVRVYNRAINADEILGLYNYAPSPIAYWRFDEGSGTIAKDLSGNNLNGTLINSPTWVSGKYGNALSFDGIDDYVNFGDNQLHRLTFVGTVSLWVNPYAYPPGINRWGKLIDKGNWGAGRNDYSIYFQGSNNTLKFEVDGSSASQSVSVANTEVPLNQWKYLTLTWDGSYIKSYIDGVQASQTVQSISPDTSGYSLQISSNNSNFAFSGLIDEVRIYNYARTQEQIVEDMNNV